MANLKTAPITKRLASLGSERWAIHFESRQRVEAGEDIIELTIGEPDVPTPDHLIDVAANAMRAGRTRYAGGKGEANLLEAIAEKYSTRTGRHVLPEQVLAFPGTQAALSFCMLSLVEAGDDVLVPDPYYATYEGVVAATGASFIPVAMDATNGFRLTAEQLEASITPNSKVLLLNSPHNPTGAVLDTDDIAAIGSVCEKHDLWIISDEVYETLIYDGTFASPFDDAALAERTICVSSISKSHAAPGFRAGWCVGPADFVKQAQAVAEAFLFGGQPFIADMTAHALTHADDTSQLMATNYQRRIDILISELEACSALKSLRPASGMFMLVDISATGLNGAAFANLLLNHGVSVMPGDAFGAQADNFIRLSLTVHDDEILKAARRIVACAQS